jgi:AraC-like DNA-binding protein
MQLKFQHIEPHPMLRPYIEKMWLFESSGRMPVDDLKLVVPNGSIKLAIAFRNGIVAAINGQLFSSKEQSISLTGLVDVPVTLDVEEDVATGTICVEFSPRGAYRFFHFSLDEIKNKIYPLNDVLGKISNQLEEQIANTESVKGKIFVLQQFLLKQLSLHKEDSIFEYCVEKIQSTQGKIAIKELEKKTGYSSRWLNMKFTDKIGASPKNLSSVTRFKQYYQAVASKDENPFLKNYYYDYYYDQADFIRTFKRFTGLTPTEFNYSKMLLEKNSIKSNTSDLYNPC